jgi:hypothetical protein
LVPPFHDGAGGVDGFWARLCGPEEPGQIIVPYHQLLVEIFAVFGSHEWVLGKDVLDLGSYFAEFDVLNKRNDSGVFANYVLKELMRCK